MKPIVAILLGDPAGIGPELVAKTAAAGELTTRCRPLVIGSRTVFEEICSSLSLDVPYTLFDGSRAPEENEILFADVPLAGADTVPFGTIGAVCGRQIAEQIDCAIALYERGLVNAVCFAPFTKASLKVYLGESIHGEMDYFTEKLHYTGPCCEINQLDGLYTTRVTSHIPLAEVAAAITEESILTAVKLLWDTIVSAGNTAPRIAVAALNPHGGENGTCGREELDVVAPAIKKAGELGMPVSGPFPSDTIFVRAFNRKEFDGVVTLYHDQGQIAIKLLGFDRGVTIEGGLPCPITTPAHGSAMDIAGKGVADTGAFLHALDCAVSMAR